jgi:hypothetical protein
MHPEATIIVTVPMALAVVAIICISTVAMLILSGLFAPTLRHKINALQQMEPAELVVAVPVAPVSTCAWLRTAVDL